MDKGTATAAAIGATSSFIADQWSLHLFGVPIAVVLAAFAGAFLSLSWQRRLPVTAKCASVWIGTAAGAYLTPVVLHHFDIGTQFQIAIAFGVGLVGEPVLHRLWKRAPQIVDKRTEDVK